MKVFFSAFSVLILAGSLSHAALPVNKKWTSTINKDFDNSQKWIDLVTELKQKHFYYSTVAGSERMLQYFSDIKTKNFAYETLVEAIDEGYPFSLSQDFISGDIEATGKDNFSQSYNLYKATANLQKSMVKWADNYLGRIDKGSFPKYLFFKALESNKAGKTDEALQYLDQTLMNTKEPSQAALASRAARTLARILYEQSKYEQSLEIYKTYLLKLNPVQPLDWIEAAWCLYRLGRYEEAVGYLYNLQAKPQDQIYLEQFIIRSLIYREKCDSGATASLAKTFDSSFGSTIEAIKTGQALGSLPVLKKIYLGTSDNYRPSQIHKALEAEKQRIKELSSGLRSMAEFLINSEMSNIARQAEASEEEALSLAARNLVVLNESLRFLKFGVAREKFNPDKVFATEATPPPATIEDKTPVIFEIHWVQWGDFWRDERLLFRAKLNNRCE